MEDASKAIEIVKEMTERGFTPQKMRIRLYRVGYSKKEIKEIFKGAEVKEKLLEKRWVDLIAIVLVLFAIFLAISYLQFLGGVMHNVPGQDWFWINDHTIKDRENITYEITFESPDIREYKGVLRDYRLFDAVDHVTMVNIGDFAVGTGDFADPSKTEVWNTELIVGRGAMARSKGGSVSGTVMNIHVIPGSRKAYDKLVSLERNREVIFIGKEVTLITITGSGFRQRISKVSDFESYVTGWGVCNVSVIYDVIQ